ncbi:DUF1150 family protein [Polycladidibacter stylochi]|uniref:BQ00720 family protein n=1 Tax=Polycladidibacter stylochi TaxID=1807766 RepID=UPI0008350D8E|nr:DUF1150 family protein [Pseudovibrio stylochi]
MSQHHEQRLLDHQDEVLEEVGIGELAYVRELTRNDICSLFPESDLSGIELPSWALVSADGTPIVLTDTRFAALAEAFEHKLKTVSVH